MNILITGVSGILGSNLAFRWKDKHDVFGVYHQHAIAIDDVMIEQGDLIDKGNVERIVEKIRPEVIVHCAAIANVDTCEEDPKLAQEANVTATENIVHALSKKTKLVHISTDLVYDGVKGNFNEEDEANPVNRYGVTKLEAEGVALRNNRALIARTNFFGWSPQDRLGLAEWVIYELSNHRRIKGFTDAVFSSIYTFELVDILEKAIQSDLTGVYNFASTNALSKYDFALGVAERFGLNRELIESSSVDEFPFKAKRAKNLSLNTDKLSNSLSVSLPSMEESLDQLRADYQGHILEKLNFQHSKIRTLTTTQ